MVDLNDLDNLNNVYRIIYSFHMPLFFLISGYCVGMKESYGEGKFLPQFKKVSVKLLLPYFVWSLLYIILSGKLKSPMRYIATFTLRGLAPLWFLATLAMCELIFFIIAKSIKSIKANRQIILLAFIAVTSIVIGFVLHNIADTYNLSKDTITMVGYYIFIAVSRLFISLPSYILGFIISRCRLLYKFRRIPALITGILLILVVSLIVIFGDLKTNCHLFDINHYWLFTLTSVLGATGVLLISYSAEKSGYAFSYLGINSLGIMILHYVPFKIIEYSYNAVSIIWNNEIFISFAATAATTLLTLGVIYLIKKKFFIYK